MFAAHVLHAPVFLYYQYRRYFARRYLSCRSYCRRPSGSGNTTTELRDQVSTRKCNFSKTKQKLIFAEDFLAQK
jgi:hypothetical protein